MGVILSEVSNANEVDMASGFRTGSRKRTRYRFPVREALLLQCPADLDQHCHKFRMLETGIFCHPDRSGGIVRRLRRATTNAGSLRGSVSLICSSLNLGGCLREPWLRREDAPRSLHSGSLRSG